MPTLPEALAEYYNCVVPVGHDPENPIGAGPFEYSEFVVGEYSLFERHEGFHVEGQPYVDELEIIDSPDDDARVGAQPALRLGIQLTEALRDANATPKQVAERVSEVLREVALPDDPAFLRRYPHQLSGGQQQRVAIAMAFVGRPDLIVLDEPTTGLDVTTQAHVLETIRSMTRECGTAGVYISHDMAVVADLADDIAVMYRGELVEHGRGDC